MQNCLVDNMALCVTTDDFTSFWTIVRKEYA